MTQQENNEEQRRDNVQQQGNNEEQQGENVATQQISNESLALLTAAVADLSGTQDELVKANERARVVRALLIGLVAGLALVVAAMIVLGTLYFLDVQQRRAAAKLSTRELACTIVSAFPNQTAPVLEDLRAKYGPCPAYVHRASGPLPGVTSTRTVAGSPTVVVVTPTPVPGRTVTVPGPTVTRTMIAEVLGPTRTVTVTATATRTCAVLICLGG